jgi:hypothetical protein
VLEGSAHYVSLLLEACCRAGHGSVNGFEEGPDGEVCPVLDDWTTQRAAEECADRTVQHIREGVLACARADRQKDRRLASPERERREAQRCLLRLAFFPTKGEISVGRALVHTDRFSVGWHRTLLPSEPASPFRQPREFLRQLQAPWRGGVMAQSGGWALSALFLLLESALLVLPRDARRRLQRGALQAAGVNPEGR